MDDLTEASLESALVAALESSQEQGGLEFRSTYHRDRCVQHFRGLVGKLKLQHPALYDSLVDAVRKLTANVRKHVYAVAADEENRKDIDRFSSSLYNLIAKDLRVELF